MKESLVNAVESFAQDWGELSSYWGLNKVMGQLHALLLASEKPLTLDDMCERLGISRGNASMNIRALKEWGIIRKVRVKGDRKDYYEIDEDIWRVITHFVRERKKRELEPVLDVISRSSDSLKRAMPDMNASDKRASETFLARLENLKQISTGVDQLLEKFIHGEEVTSTSLTQIPITWK